MNVTFLKSAQSIRDSIAPNFSEVAFLGRSNVGKSSFLNRLTRQAIAKTSSTPGKTKLLNFFEVNYKGGMKAVFVDLPGFGYAKVSKSEHKNWERNLTEFIENRNSIKLFLLLVDSRHTNLDIDKGVYEYVSAMKNPDQKVVRVFTKVDKLKQNDFAKLKQKFPGELYISNLKNRGIDQANDVIYTTLFGNFNADS